MFLTVAAALTAYGPILDAGHRQIVGVLRGLCKLGASKTAGCLMFFMSIHFLSGLFSGILCVFVIGF